MVPLFGTTNKSQSMSITKSVSATSATVERNRNSGQSSRRRRWIRNSKYYHSYIHHVCFYICMQSTDKKLTGKTSYADLEEEWGAQTLISLYIRDYDKKVFDNCIKLGSNRWDQFARHSTSCFCLSSEWNEHRFHAADFQHLKKLDLSHQLIGDEQLKRLWAITPT